MSYGMHNYLADKAKQNTYMQKRAADPILDRTPLAVLQNKLEANTASDKKALDAKVNDRRTPSVFTGEKPLNSFQVGLNRLTSKAGEYYSRARAFVAEHPEILYGAAGAAAGAGIGALVSPKHRLLGTLAGFGLGGTLTAGGKLLWDKYGDNVLASAPAKKIKSWLS